MIELAPDLFQLTLPPRNAVNVYLMGDVLVDSGLGLYGKRILSQLEGRAVSAHTLTHCHPDHIGSTNLVCDTRDIPLWCGERDVPAMESGDQTMQKPPSTRWLDKLGKQPAHPVARALKEGDDAGGFTVLDAPGHTPGHIAYWRESDRALILGDVVMAMNPFIMKKGLREPFRPFTPDPAQNRDSARKLAALNPELICFGHGAPCRDPEAFQRFVASLD